MPEVRTLTALALALVLAGCGSTGRTTRLMNLAGLIDPVWRAEDYSYRISPGDELGVRFPVNSDMDTQVTVGPDGRAIFPYIPPVRVAGLTIEEANARVSETYKPVLRVPITQLSVYNYGGGQIYVAGEVKAAGAKNIRGEYTVVRAIFDAGGFEPTAKTGKVVLLRRRPTDGRVLMREIDVSGALKGEAWTDIRVLPGDVIFVPRSAIAEVNRVVQQYVTNALPFGLSYSLNNRLTGP